jgi:LysM repeat protein
MKHLTQSRWLIAALLLLALVLVACERPINPGSDVPTVDPNAATTQPIATANINVQPTADPLATAVPADTTPDPAGGGDATAVPDTNPTTVPDSNEPRGEVSHTVVAGDTISGLSLLYDIPAEVIVSANNLTNVDSLDLGQVLIIPAEGTEVVATAVPADATAVPPVTEERSHVVQAGENLYRIGLQYGFSFEELATYNNIANPNVLEVGQIIKIPPSN